MARPQEKLAESLEILRNFQNQGAVAIRSGDLTRTHRERLLRNGFLEEVFRGWYIPCRPGDQKGDSTAWYTSFWSFCAVYLADRFGEKWSLSPEQSLILHAGNRAVPKQLLVRALTARNKVTQLPHSTSIFETRAALPNEEQSEVQEGLRMFSLPSALILAGPTFYSQNSMDVRTALLMIQDSSELLAILLDGEHTTVAGRLAGAFRHVGREQIADEIIDTMSAAGYSLREVDPFSKHSSWVLPRRETSPYINRLQLMWQEMRETVIRLFPRAPSSPLLDPAAYLRSVEESYVTDAYHSLSIEGYQVTPALIERVQSGHWSPENEGPDREHRDALAARGYWLAFQAVEKSIEEVLGGKNPGDVCDEQHRTWYRELFSPSVVAGIIDASDLAGYRRDQVYIRRSKHVPLNYSAVRDCMPTFFDLLRHEMDPAVRVVLGHFIFVYIHPYMDGNGRIGRFLMNVMLAAGGYRWTVIPVTRRNEYMSALERASVDQDIEPFTVFLADLVKGG